MQLIHPVYYSQVDPRWGNIPYTIDGDKQETIGYSGCGPTCAAMILASWVDPKITPKETAEMAIQMKDRTPNDGTEWEYFKHIADKYKIPFAQTGSFKTVTEALNNGALVVCSMGRKSAKERGYFTIGGHFILAWGIDPIGRILVNDPISKLRTDTPTPIEIFEGPEFKQGFIFYPKEEIKLNWKQIIEKVASDPTAWEKAINAAVAAAKADGNLGDLEILQYLPALIEKIYNTKG